MAGGGGDGSDTVEADSRVIMYTDETQQVVLQDMVFHSSCSQNLALKDTFGGQQLVQWTNEDQGNITCFANITYDFLLEIPIGIEGQTFIFSSVTGQASFLPGDDISFDLTDQVAGEVYEPGEFVPLTLQAELDLTVRKTYFILIRVTGETEAGVFCFGFGREEFTAGTPIGPLFPTVSPTLFPTSSAFPTPDPEESACELAASIECAFDGVRGNVDCEGQTDSAGRISCSGAALAEAIRFEYLPKSPLPASDDVWITASNNDGLIYFDGLVSPGDIFEVADESSLAALDDRLNLQINNVVNGGQGPNVLEESFDDDRIRCNRDELVLDTLYGPSESLRMVGFRPFGGDDFDIVKVFIFRYYVRNLGNLEANATSAIIDSPFSGDEPFEALTESTIIGPRTGLLVFEETVKLDLLAREENEIMDMIAMSSSGVNNQSGETCGLPDAVVI